MISSDLYCPGRKISPVSAGKIGSENARKVAERCGWQRIDCSRGGAMRTVEDIHEEIYRRVTALLKA